MSAIGIEVFRAQDLCDQLLKRQPEARALLERLVSRLGGKNKLGAFAVIEHGRCSACHVSVAAMRLQQAKAGEFINCASCLRFLYIAESQALKP